MNVYLFLLIRIVFGFGDDVDDYMIGWNDDVIDDGEQGFQGYEGVDDEYYEYDLLYIVCVCVGGVGCQGVVQVKGE